MGGTLGLESAPGAGSTFRFDLPFETGGQVDEPAARRANELPRLRGHVLVAEDNEVNREVARATLESFGLQVSVADDGLEVLKAVSEKNFDLILMDCQMPHLDGIEATQRIRASEKAGKGGSRRRLPIVAVTANAIEGDRERFIAAGMDDYLSKPFKRTTLHAVSAKWLVGADAHGPGQIVSGARPH